MSRPFITLSVCYLFLACSISAFAADQEAWDRYFKRAEQSRVEAIRNASDDLIEFRRLTRNETTAENTAALQEKISHLQGLRNGTIMPKVPVSKSSRVGEIVSLGGDSTSVYRIISPTECIIDRMSRSQEVQQTRSGKSRTINKSWHELFWVKGINTRGMSRDVVQKRGRHTNKIDHGSLYEVVGTQMFELPDGIKKDLVVISKIAKSEVDAQMRSRQSEE